MSRRGLLPARLLVDNDHAFAAGVLVVSVIDFMAGLHRYASQLRRRPVGNDFETFVENKLPGFVQTGLATRFYDEFRNGLIHDNRIKNGGEFSFETTTTVTVIVDGDLLRINPDLLTAEVTEALRSLVERLKADSAARERLQSACAFCLRRSLPLSNMAVMSNGNCRDSAVLLLEQYVMQRRRFDVWSGRE